MFGLSKEKKLIYSTSYSDVYETIDSISKKVSQIMMLKFSKITNEIKSHLDNEILFVHFQKHQNLVNFKDFHISNDSCYFSLENCQDQLITSYVAQKGGFSEKEALSLFFIIYQVYDLYKKENMPTRDFSFDNIFMSSGEVKVHDFGLYYTFKLGDYNQSIINYCKPPETNFEGKFFPNISEVWSLGIILFYMLYGNLPWRGKTEAGFFNAVKDIPLKISKEKKQLSSKTTELLNLMLTVDYNKRIRWVDLKSHEAFNEILGVGIKNSVVKSPEKKWNMNIFSFYCKNDFILKNSFMNEEKNKKEKELFNYPSLEENVKSISDNSDVLMRISTNTKKLGKPNQDEENFKLMEEKRIIEIDQIIQRIIDSNRMNCSLNFNQNADSPNKNLISSSYIQKNEGNKSNFKTNNFSKESNFKESMFIGKSFIKSQAPLEKTQNLVKFFDEYLNIFNNQLEKYNVLGKTIGDFELVFRKILDLELWRIQRFLLLKKLIKFRFAMHAAFKQEENVLNLQFWKEFIKSEKFTNFMKKLETENNSLQKDLEKLFLKTSKSLKKFQLNESNKIEKFLNLDLKQNFDSLFFICLYLHTKTINPKIEVALAYNDMDKAVKMLMHKAEIIDCLIINEIEFLVEIPEYFDLKEFQNVINSLNFDLLQNYVTKKEKVLEMWKPKYIF